MLRMNGYEWKNESKRKKKKRKLPESDLPNLSNSFKKNEASGAEMLSFMYKS